jgi:hypothetical protein
MTQKKATPDQHSGLVGGSTASRRINCTRSYLEERRAKDLGLVDKSSEYAKEGTFCHDMAEKVMTGEIKVEQIDGFKMHYPPKGDDAAYEYVGTSEEAALVRTATDALDALFDQMEEETGKEVEVMYEQSGAFPGIEGAFGTADTVARAGDLMLIADYKFGRGAVEVEGNKQLLFYACAMRNMWPKFFEGVQHICLAIIQPKLREEADTDWVQPEDLDAFEAELQEAIRINEAGTGDYAKGPWCKFARCQSICPLYTGAAVAVAVQGALAKEPPVKMSREETSAFLSDAMELAEMAEEWAKVIRGIVHEKIDGGFAVPGWKTVAKRSSGRDWIKPEEEVIDALVAAGLSEDEAAPRVLLSVAQAEKELKRIGSHVKKIDEGWYEKRVSSGTTLTREGDPRDEALAPAAKASRLGELLEQKLAKRN